MKLLRKIAFCIGFILLACTLPVVANNSNVNAAAAPADKYDAICNSSNAYKFPICNKYKDEHGVIRDKQSLVDIVQIVVQSLFFVIGCVSVVMIIYGGIRFAISGGDSTAVGNAKNTILYSVIGLVVAILAYAIVSFVFARLK